ncbi:MAG: zinc ribbon domain-containing protein [Acidobacteriota bacterium]
MKCRDAEARYQELVGLRKSGKLTQEEWEQQLKALMLQDVKGRYWTIGAQTGKWYYYDGTRWAEATPDDGAFAEVGSIATQPTPPVAAPPSTSVLLCPHCGFENLAGRSLCSRCGRDMSKAAQERETPSKSVRLCPVCGAALDPETMQCRTCAKSLVGTTSGASSHIVKPRTGEVVLRKDSSPGFLDVSTGSGRHGDERELRALNLVSCFKFLGGAGLIIGLVSGVFYGAIRDIGPALNSYPLLQGLRGRWIGGMMFGLIGAGGIGLLSGLYGVLLGFLYNLLAIIFGGIRIKVFRVPSA